MNEESSEASPLKVRKEIGAQGVAKRCPNCGDDIPVESNLCTKCGFNTTKGKTVQQMQKTRKRAISSSIILILLGVILYGAIKLKEERPQAEPTTAPPASEQPVAKTAPETAKPAAPKVMLPIPETAPIAPPIENTSPRALLDKNIPMAQVGENTVFRDKNGHAFSGKLISARFGKVILKKDDGSQQVIDVNDMDQNSRLKVDEDFRDQLIAEKEQAAP